MLVAHQMHGAAFGDKNISAKIDMVISEFRNGDMEGYTKALCVPESEAKYPLGLPHVVMYGTRSSRMIEESKSEGLGSTRELLGEDREFFRTRKKTSNWTSEIFIIYLHTKKCHPSLAPGCPATQGSSESAR